MNHVQNLSTRARRSVSRHEFGPVLLLFPALRHLVTLKSDFDKLLEGCDSSVRNRFYAMVNSLHSTVLICSFRAYEFILISIFHFICDSMLKSTVREGARGFRRVSTLRISSASTKRWHRIRNDKQRLTLSRPTDRLSRHCRTTAGPRPKLLQYSCPHAALAEIAKE